MKRQIVPRKISHNLIQLIENKVEFNNVLLIDGARQVGKTTLVHEAIRQLGIPWKTCNLEEARGLVEKIDRCADFSEFTELLAVELRFKPGGREILFIDEAQESRRLGSYVRFMKENWPNTQVILSGSSMARIFRDDIRFPVGRVTTLHVQPFSFEEFLRAREEGPLLEQIGQFTHTRHLAPNTHQRLLEQLDDYLDVGGLPEVVTTFAAKGAWARLRENLLLGYYHDFKRVFGEERQAYFIAALKTTAHLLGVPFKNSHVAALLDGGKNKEIIHTLGQLEAWRLVLHVEQRGPAVETHYHPKRYLFDNGIAKALRELAMPRIHLLHTLDAGSRTALGGLIENVVANVLVAHGMELTGWKKTTSGSEIDFVVKWQGEAIPVECKAALRMKNTHCGGVRDFLTIHKAPLGVVIGLAPFELRALPGNQRILILPLYLAEQLENILRSL